MTKQFTLGQAVEITGQYVQNLVTAKMVDAVEERIKTTGQPEVSRKYSIKNYGGLIGGGIIVGIRSIAGERIHYLDAVSGEVFTKTKRQAAYLVALDMRGLVYVPADMVKEAQKAEAPFEIFVDFEDVLIDDGEFNRLIDLNPDLLMPYLSGDKLRLIPG